MLLDFYNYTTFRLFFSFAIVLWFLFVLHCYPQRAGGGKDQIFFEERERKREKDTDML